MQTSMHTSAEMRKENIDIWISTIIGDEADEVDYPI